MKPGELVVTVFTSSLVLLSCRHPDSGCRSALGYSVFQILPSLFPPPLSPPTNYQTEGSGARLGETYIILLCIDYVSLRSVRKWHRKLCNHMHITLEWLVSSTLQDFEVVTAIGSCDSNHTHYRVHTIFLASTY